MFTYWKKLELERTATQWAMMVAAATASAQMMMVDDDDGYTKRHNYSVVARWIYFLSEINFYLFSPIYVLAQPIRPYKRTLIWICSTKTYSKFHLARGAGVWRDLHKANLYIFKLENEENTININFTFKMENISNMQMKRVEQSVQGKQMVADRKWCWQRKLDGFFKKTSISLH